MCLHCVTCVSRLGVDYLDCYLVHTPFGGKVVESWGALLELQRQGVVK